jgi:hypothetical protein
MHNFTTGDFTTGLRLLVGRSAVVGEGRCHADVRINGTVTCGDGNGCKEDDAECECAVQSM